MFKVLKLSFDFKKCVLPSFKDSIFEYLEENKIRIALMGLVAGLVGGMIGVGGGMISNPLLLSMGFNPQVKFFFLVFFNFNSSKFKFFNIVYI
jgi:hypothetical protein